MTRQSWSSKTTGRLRLRCRPFCGRRGYQVLSAVNGQDGRRLVEAHAPDLVITDMMMPRMGGFPVLESLTEMENTPLGIMMIANEGSWHKAFGGDVGGCGLPPKTIRDGSPLGFCAACA